MAKSSYQLRANGQEQVKVSSAPSLQQVKFYLTIYNTIKEGKNLKQICHLFGKSKQAINWYAKTLKKAGFIKKVGYGTWEVIKPFDSKQVKVIKWTYSPSSGGGVRGHAFVFRLILPQKVEWISRLDFLREKFGECRVLPNKGLKVVFRDKKVHFYKSCIVIYDCESYVADLASRSKELALRAFLFYFERLEEALGMCLQINKAFVFRVCKEHMGLMKNCLAKAAEREHFKVAFFLDGKRWCLCDNSLKLHELETVRLGEAVFDSEGLQEYFNSHKRTGFKVTPEVVLQIFGDITQTMISFNHNFEVHLVAVNGLRAAVEELARKVGEIK